jgi:hypothetical protein
MLELIMLSRMKKLLASLALTLVFVVSPAQSHAALNLSSYGITSTATLENNTLLLSFVFQNLALDGGLRYSIPKYANSYIEISPDLESSGTLMALYIDLADLNGTGITTQSPTTLPGGRAIPGITTGKLPAVAFTLTNAKNVTVYASTTVFGFFIPVNINLSNTIITAKFTFNSGKKYGLLSIVGKDSNSANSGILMLFSKSNLNS